MTFSRLSGFGKTSARLHFAVFLKCMAEEHANIPTRLPCFSGVWWYMARLSSFHDNFVNMARSCETLACTWYTHCSLVLVLSLCGEMFWVTVAWGWVGYCTSFATQCTTDLAANKIEGWHQPPCHLSNSNNTSKAAYVLLKRLGQSTSLQPVRPLNDLTPFSPLTCLHANTFNLPLKTEYIWYVGFFFQRP